MKKTVQRQMFWERYSGGGRPSGTDGATLVACPPLSSVQGCAADVHTGHTRRCPAYISSAVITPVSADPRRHYISTGASTAPRTTTKLDEIVAKNLTKFQLYSPASPVIGNKMPRSLRSACGQ